MIRSVTLKTFPASAVPSPLRSANRAAGLVRRQGSQLELGTDSVPAVSKDALRQKLCDCSGTIEFEVEEHGFFGSYTRTIEVPGRQ